MRFFDEIVGLRAYLAIWVAVGHGMQLAGYGASKSAIGAILLSGHAAVAIFVIVSGFVITNLLLVRRETYRHYIIRRFFRLYPAFVVSCAAGYLVIEEWLHVVNAAPWAGVDGWPAYARSIGEVHDQTMLNFWPHMVLHATMLHGLVPDQIIDRTAMTFLPAAWSVSLEWQFYLVAPVMLHVFRNQRHAIMLVGTALLALFAYQRGWLGHYDIGASIAGASPYFAVGMISRLGYDRLVALRLSPWLGVAGTLFAATALREPLIGIVWGVFLTGSAWREQSPWFQRVFEATFISAPARALGNASYSLYLIHRPVQILLASIAIGMVSINRPLMLVCQIAAILIAIPVSLIMYQMIERPGIRLGQRVAQRLGQQPAVVVPGFPA